MQGRTKFPFPHQRGKHGRPETLGCARRSRCRFLAEDAMKRNAFLGLVLLSLAVTLAVGGRRKAFAGGPSAADYRVLAPIRHGNLTVFPVVASTSHDTGGFLTLDEGLKSGEVEVTESGSVRGMVRRPRGSHGVLRPEYQEQAGAQVNKLVLVNNAKRPLLLLAGEIVTGGKQ